MKVGILCAVEKELAPFLAHIKIKETVKKSMLTFHCGTIDGVEVVALFCGVCKVNAAIATQVLIDTFSVDAVVNAGTAGGMDPKLQVLDAVISEEVAYHDVAQGVLTEYHPWMQSRFFKADARLLYAAHKLADKTEGIYFGRMVTGEAFIVDEGRQAILDAFSPLSVDMETGSIAHVCYANGVPFISIRCITDNATHSGEENFAKNCVLAAERAKDLTMLLLAALSL